MFQSTPPRGGRHITILHPVRSDIKFQSTPPRGGRPRCHQAQIAVTRHVSIHAPAGGATFVLPMPRYAADCFNPRPRGGGDPEPVGGPISLADVSIHAPAGGATIVVWPMVPTSVVFQSTPPRGGRPSGNASTMNRNSFQSTPPRGGRHQGARRVIPHTGVSIHAPAGGATYIIM